MNRDAVGGLVAITLAAGMSGCATTYNIPWHQVDHNWFKVPNEDYDEARRLIKKEDKHFGGVYAVPDMKLGLKLYDSLLKKGHSEMDANWLSILFITPGNYIQPERNCDEARNARHARYHRLWERLPQDRKDVLRRGYQRIEPSLNIMKDCYWVTDPEEFFAHMAAPEPELVANFNYFRALLRDRDMEALSAHLDVLKDAMPVNQR